MVADAAAAWHYSSPNGKKFLRIQLLTIAGLLAGTHPDYEPDLNGAQLRMVFAGFLGFPLSLREAETHMR